MGITQGFGGDDFDDEFKEAFGEGFDDEEFQDEDFSFEEFNEKGFDDDNDNY